MSRHKPTDGERAAIDLLTVAGYTVLRTRSYEHLRTQVALERQMREDAREQAEHSGRWALDCLGRERTLSDRLDRVVSAAATLGVDICDINHALQDAEHETHGDQAARAARMVTRARACAGRMHAGQVDKRGRDYFNYHLTPVAALLAPFGPYAEAAGWLHDVVEDTPLSLDDLEGVYHRHIVAAVDAVTRRDGETYDDLITRSIDHRLGRLVKLADNTVNLAGNDALAKVDAVAAVRLRGRYARARRRLVGGHPELEFAAEQMRTGLADLVVAQERSTDG